MKNATVIFLMYVIAFVGIATVLDNATTAEAKKSQGVTNTKYGSATKTIVCGDRLCSESSSAITSSECKSTEIAIANNCLPIQISGATISKTHINEKNTFIVIIDAKSDGMLTISDTAMALNGVFMVLVDDQEWDDVQINPDNITVSFLAGNEKIEFVAEQIKTN